VHRNGDPLTSENGVGKLYSWNEYNAGLVEFPGWRVPTYAEYIELLTFVSDDFGGSDPYWEGGQILVNYP